MFIIWIAVLFHTWTLLHASIENDKFEMQETRSNEDFIKWLNSENLLKHETITNVLRRVDRFNFVPPTSTCFLADIQTELTHGAIMEYPSLALTYLNNIEPYLKTNGKVLEIGSGSGYLTNIVSLLMNSTGQVIGMEHIPELVNISIQNILHSNPKLLMEGNIKFVVADGRKGYAKKAPYDVIIVSGSVPELTNSLVDQLKPGGRLIIPIGKPEKVQTLFAFNKLENGTLQKTFLLRGSFGYLQDRKGQVEIWVNGTKDAEANKEKLKNMEIMLENIARNKEIINEINSMDKIRGMFEKAQSVDVEKRLDSFERDDQMLHFFKDLETQSPVPYELQAAVNIIDTALPTKRTRKSRKSTTEDHDQILWR